MVDRPKNWNESIRRAVAHFVRERDAGNVCNYVTLEIPEDDSIERSSTVDSKDKIGG